MGLWIRLTIAESPLFREVEEHDAKVKAPIVEVLRRYPPQVLLAIGARVGVDVAFYTFVLFITTYVATYLGLPSSYALNAVLIAAAVQVFLIPWFGGLSDRFGRRPVYLFGAVGAAIWVFVFFALLDTGSFALIVLAAVVALFFHAAMYGPQASFIAEMFPTTVRYTGASMGYQLARNPRRSAGPDHLDGAARPLRHLPGRRPSTWWRCWSSPRSASSWRRRPRGSTCTPTRRPTARRTGRPGDLDPHEVIATPAEGEKALVRGDAAGASPRTRGAVACTPERPPSAAPPRRSTTRPPTCATR